MSIKQFKGRKYDHETLLKFFDNVDKKIEEAENKKMGYCTFCGAKRPSGEIGIGGGCEKITEKFKDGYIDLFCSDKKEQWQTDLFEAYKKYVKYARALFLHNNKNAKNNFIKSFYKSMEENKENKISKKQLEIIERNADFKGYLELLEKYKKYVYHKFGYVNLNLYKMSLDFDRDFALYCKIQYAKAWI